MVVTLVHIRVKKENIDEFIRASLRNHEGSIRETGNLRFDILQDDNDPSKFIFYEVYDSDEAVAAHKSTPHYTEWRDVVAPWMEKPREGIRHNVLAPKDKMLW
ncbi:MAG TPA: antibiotic biosynthesis monooxygenase [Cyclobacteriaceae bacterium]|nr:antibiotic biosynthesis monooxygenase [Cyclobacteriaceae bacterium]